MTLTEINICVFIVNITFLRYLMDPITTGFGCFLFTMFAIWFASSTAIPENKIEKNYFDKDYWKK
jgi:hypothetical protein